MRQTSLRRYEYSKKELQKVLKQLEADNVIMYRDRKIYDVSD